MTLLELYQGPESSLTEQALTGTTCLAWKYILTSDCPKSALNIYSMFVGYPNTDIPKSEYRFRLCKLGIVCIIIGQWHTVALVLIWSICRSMTAESRIGCSERARNIIVVHRRGLESIPPFPCGLRSTPLRAVVYKCTYI